MNAANVFFKFFKLAHKNELFFFRHCVKTHFLLNFHVLQTLDGCFHSLEIGKHTAQPTLIDEGYTCSLGFRGDEFTSLSLGAHHQNGAAVGRQLLGELHRVLEHRQRFFQVDNVDFVAMAKNERGHFGVPKASLVSEMDAGF